MDDTEILKTYTVRDLRMAKRLAGSEVYWADGHAHVFMEGEIVTIKAKIEFGRLFRLVCHAGLYPVDVLGCTDGRLHTTWRLATEAEQARFVELDM
jgi:hypothetical protein